MKFYIAARLGKRSEVKTITKMIEGAGHRVSSGWLSHGNVKPYEKHPTKSRKYAIQSIKEVRRCDVFVLLSDEAGTGMYIELGAAISSNIERRSPLIYVIGNHLSRSMFFFLPYVKRKQTIKEVLKELENEN